MFRIKNIRGNTIVKNNNISPVPTATLKLSNLRHKFQKQIPKQIIKKPEKQLNIKNQSIFKKKINIINNIKDNNKINNQKKQAIINISKNKVDQGLIQKKVEIINHQNQEKIQNINNKKEIIDNIPKQNIEDINNQKNQSNKEDNTKYQKQNIIENNLIINQQQTTRQHILVTQKQEKKKKQQEQERKRQAQLKQQIQRINQRRKHRQIEKQKRKQIQDKNIQRQKLIERQIEDHNGLIGGMLHLSQEVSHFEMGDVIIDAQIKKILRTSFAHFPNGLNIQLQKQELNRINLSYQLIRNQQNHPLINGLKNFRLEIFNRIGFMIMDAQRSGFADPNFHIIETDMRSQLPISNVKIMKGLQKHHINNLTEKTVAKTDEDCSVCINTILKGEQCRKIECGHIFHIECIDLWLQSNANCPSCRYNVKYGKK